MKSEARAGGTRPAITLTTQKETTMEKLSKEQFVLASIANLRNAQSKGIHVVYSGFNAAFKKYYGEESRATTDALLAKGVIEGRPAKGGFMIYKKGDLPVVTNDKRIQKTLDSILR